jgi:hypothetical protein
MKDRRKPRSFSSTEEFLQDLVKDLVRLLGGFTLLPQRIARVPDPRRRQAAPGSTRGVPPARTSIWPLLLGFVLVAAMPAWAASPSLLPQARLSNSARVCPLLRSQPCTHTRLGRSHPAGILPT